MNTYQYYLLKALTNWQAARITYTPVPPPRNALPSLSSLDSEIGRYQVYSFDVFDTLLFRDVDPSEYPKRHVCSLISLLLARYGHDVSIESILELRAEAESLARNFSLEKGKDYECRIEDVFEQIYLLVFEAYGVKLEEQISLPDLVEYEFDAENQHLQAMPGAIELLSKIKINGAKIILISDMYLSAAHIQRILEKNKLWRFVDFLAVSCEYGLTKASGRLFEKLITDQHLIPGQTLHIGDNLVSDVQQPKRKGLDSYYLYSEEEIARRSIRQRELRLANLFGEFSYWGEMLFQKESKPLNSAKDIGYYRLGPVFGLFAYELAKTALSGGYQKVFFMARDGYLFSKLFKQFMAQWNLAKKIQHPQTDYVYVSRASTCFISPEIDKGNLISLAQRVNRHEGIGALLSTLGFSKDDFSDLLDEILSSEIDKDLAQSSRLMAKLLEHPKFNDAICLALAEKSRLLKQYLRQQQMLGGDEKQLWVDIGWNGSILSFLENLTDSKQFSNIDVLYFGRMYGCRTKHFNLLPGIIFDQHRHNPLEHLINECRELFEVCASSNEGSVIGYREEAGKIFPELVKSTAQSEQQLLVLSLQNGIQAWCEEFIKLLNHITPNVDSLRPSALVEAGKLLTGYYPQELDILKSLYFDLNWGSQKRVSLSEYLGHLNNNGILSRYQPTVTNEQLRIEFSGNETKQESHLQKTMEQIHHFIEVLKTEGDLVVYGVGTVTTLLAPHIIDKIAFFVDGNTELHGKSFMGKEIKKPESILEHNEIKVVATPIGRKNVIKNKLAAFDGKIFYFDDYIDIK